jgi:hypothetical protein
MQPVELFCSDHLASPVENTRWFIDFKPQYREFDDSIVLLVTLPDRGCDRFCQGRRSDNTYPSYPCPAKIHFFEKFIFSDKEDAASENKSF